MATLSPGLYSAKIKSASFGKNQNDKMNVALDLEILGLVRNGQVYPTPAPESRGIQLFFVSEENARISIETLNKIGWAGTDLNEFNSPKCSLIGAVVMLRCEEEEFTGRDGQTRLGERWSFATSANNSATVRNTDTSGAVARQANAKFAHLLRGGASRAAQINRTPPPISTTTPPPATDSATANEEIPF
jgi:hypothetical protein